LYFSIRFKQACVSSTGEAPLRRRSSEAFFNVSLVRSCDSAKAGLKAQAAAPTPAKNCLRDADWFMFESPQTIPAYGGAQRLLSKVAGYLGAPMTGRALIM